MLFPLLRLRGLNETVTPCGKPEADKVTVPVNPFIGVTVTVAPPLDPWVTVTLPGDTERLKSGLAEAAGQLLTRLKTFTEPMPDAKSQPTRVPNAG